jgi:hypothetical protein
MDILRFIYSNISSTISFSFIEDWRQKKILVWILNYSKTHIIIYQELCEEKNIASAHTT